MKLLGDWKWYAALAVFALFTVLVVCWPRPGAKPSRAPVTPAAAEPNDAPADLPPAARPNPTPAEYDAMLRYTVQEGDTAAGIARLFVVSEDELRRVNHVTDGGDLTVWKQIWIPAQ